MPIFQKRFFLNKIDEKLKKAIQDYIHSNNGINKFILLLRKGFYRSEYMDEWKRLSETSLPEKDDLYSNLNMENITDADYMHEKRNLMILK